MDHFKRTFGLPLVAFKRIATAQENVHEFSAAAPPSVQY